MKKPVKTGGAVSSQAVLYARVSSKEQEKEGFSIPSQQKLLRSYAQANSIAVAREFIDVETAKQTGRTGFGEMVSFLKKTPNCRLLLVEKTDRLYRNLKDWVIVDDLRLEVHFVKENVVLSSDSRSSEKFMHGIKVLMAKNYIDNLSEECSKGMREKAEQGLWPSAAPLGYRNVSRADGKKIIEPDPERAPFVIRLFERYATGRHSLEEATALARREGLIFPGNKWPISRSEIHRTLQRRIYIGEFEWGGKLYQGSHTPLVTRDLWERVQQTLGRRNVRKTRRVKHDFAFARLVTCGHCGCALVAELQKARYVYYRCTGNKGRCGERYVREEVLAEAFAEVIDGLPLGNEALEYVKQALRESHGDEARFHKEAVERLRTGYDRLQARLEAMYVDKLDGKVSEAFYEARAAEWKAEQDRTRSEIAAHEGADREYVDLGLRLLDIATAAPRLFRNAPMSEKRRLLEFLCLNSSWANGRLSVTFRKPFDLLHDRNIAAEKATAVEGVSDGSCREWYRYGELNPGLMAENHLS